MALIPGVPSLGDLEDVQITSKTDKDSIIYDTGSSAFVDKVPTDTPFSTVDANDKVQEQIRFVSYGLIGGRPVTGQPGEMYATPTSLYLWLP